MNTTIYLPGVFWEYKGYYYTIVGVDDGYEGHIVRVGDDLYEEVGQTPTFGNVQDAHTSARRLVDVL